MVMKNLVILGGGYGGLTIVLDLLKQGIPEDIQITLVDKNPYHSLKTEFYTIAAGTAADRDVRIDFPEDERIRYVFGEVEKIDVENENILFKDISTIVSYDYLVIALGCEDNYHGIRGAEELSESVTLSDNSSAPRIP